MPLTPADVHNVAFSKPPIGTRGYNEGEVDQFLDLVEAELGSLVEENADLRQRVDELTAELNGARSSQGSNFANPAPAPAPAPTPEPASNADLHLKAAQLLGLAQETADRLTTDARRDADALLSDAQAESDRLVGEAQAKADSLTGEAQLSADSQVREAQEKAAALRADAERKHAEITRTINQQRYVLEGRIEQLRTFEREYRTRLKGLLESQLAELGQRSSAAPAEGEPFLDED